MYSSSAGILVSTDNVNFYQLTDHNRQPIAMSYETVEKAQRMANGTMRKFVVAKKRKVSVSWNEIPSGTLSPYNPTSSSLSMSGLTFTVDGNKGGAWMKSFYETNVFKPIYVKLVFSKDDYIQNAASAFYPSPANPSYETFNAFITGFDYNIIKRLPLTDYVDVKFDFTEI